jgi:rhodanese-related sulfurtransferase
MNATISCKDLKERMTAGAIAIDVMTPEDYAACHLAGAINACIYEMIFLERVAEFVTDRNTELVVYDATGSKKAAPLARERLLHTGYRNVTVLEGGLSAWRAAGLPVEASAPGAGIEPKSLDGTYRVEVEKSMFEWIGRNLNNRHHGRISIQSGEIVIRGGIPSAGKIVLDMNTVSNLDLQEPAWHDRLLHHLKSEDFFAVERFPTASFRLTGWEKGDGGSPEAPNGLAIGDLTIKDITRPVRVSAIVAPQMDRSLKAHAFFDLDRTLWDASYGSGKLYERLGMHLVHDLISLELFVLAQKV